MTTEISTQVQPRGVALQSFQDKMKFGEAVANSEFAPKDFRGKPASCMLAIECGAEIGLGPMQSLQSIAVVNGRPAVYGDAALAVVKASHVCEYVTEAVDGDGEQMVATCTAKRRGYPSPTVVKFTVADAKKAGLWGKSGPWSQYPKRMLQMRARGFALRDAFPDVLKGLVTAEEAQDYQHPEPAREPVTVRPKFHEPEIRTAPTDVAPLTTERIEDDPVARARLAISQAKTIDALDTIRRRIADRVTEGVFTSEQGGELAQLAMVKAEILGCEEVTT